MESLGIVCRPLGVCRSQVDKNTALVHPNKTVTSFIHCSDISISQFAFHAGSVKRCPVLECPMDRDGNFWGNYIRCTEPCTKKTFYYLTTVQQQHRTTLNYSWHTTVHKTHKGTNAVGDYFSSIFQSLQISSDWICYLVMKTFSP